MSDQPGMVNTPLKPSLENYPSFKKETNASSVYRHPYFNKRCDKSLTVQDSFEALVEGRVSQHDKSLVVLRQKTAYEIVPDDSKPDFQDFITTEDESLQRPIRP
ncbi:hypothetical protein Gasu2_46890 [Galdieria sulphuraria]|nr:hypothetical protein Gasu2_46890 [Galdieria sulphuraria]